MNSVLVCSILLCSQALAATLVAQQCPGGRAPAGDVGIRGLLCTGPAASCAINVRARDGLRHEFAVEPVIAAISADTELRVGDTLVAVDSLLITTAAGGEHLARLGIDSTVRVLIRRQGVLREIPVSARRGCGVGSLRVSR